MIYRRQIGGDRDSNGRAHVEASCEAVCSTQIVMITKVGHTLLEWQYEGTNDNGWT